MQTHNIVSTPEITGNIGTCTTQTVKVDTAYNVLTREYRTIATNSCTGEVTTYDSWTLGLFPWAFIFLGILVFWAIVGMNAEKNTLGY